MMGLLTSPPFVFNSLLHSAIEYGDTFRWKTANNVPVELSLRNGENSLYEIYSRTYGRKTPLLIPSYKRKGYSDTIGEYMLISALNKTADVDNATIWSHVNPKPINSVSVPFVKYGWDVQNLERWTTQENLGSDIYNDVKANNARSVKDHRGNYLLHYARLSPQNKNAAISLTYSVSTLHTSSTMVLRQVGITRLHLMQMVEIPCTLYGGLMSFTSFTLNIDGVRK